MPYVPTLKERIDDAKHLLLPAVCGLIVLGVAGWVYWQQFAGGSTAPVAPRTAALAPEEKASAELRAALEADVARLEKSIADARASGATYPALDSLLSRAIGRQRALLKATPGDNAAETHRLVRLETERSQLRARQAAAESRALEQDAQLAAARGAQAEALPKLREALRLQHEANSFIHNQDVADMAREVRLAKAVEAAATAPLRATVAAAGERADAALAVQDWPAATKAFHEARTAQLEINALSPDNRAANLAALEEIDTEIASLRAGDLVARIAATEKAATDAQAAGKTTDAAAGFAIAMRQQEELNAQFPRSRFASAERVAALAAKRKNALTFEPLARVATLDREIAALLRRRQSAAARDKIAEAAGLLSRVTPGATHIEADAALRRRIEFLDFRRPDIEALQADLDRALAPLPGFPSTLMLRTEVSQDWYTRVMNSNPSRNQGRGLPVDSVSWNDARTFCERLSWLLGTTVRLPRENEFRAAWPASMASAAWSQENSAGRSRETGRLQASVAGFQDVAGNVAEWLENEQPDAGTATVAGGSFLDPVSAFAQLPFVLVEKRTRARHIGFRCVVEMPAEKN